MREAAHVATAHARGCMPTYRLGSLRAEARSCGKSSTYLKPSSFWAMSVIPATEPRGSRTTTKRSRISWLGSMTSTTEYLSDDIHIIVSRWQQCTNAAKPRIVHMAWGEDPVAEFGNHRLLDVRDCWCRLSGQHIAVLPSRHGTCCNERAVKEQWRSSSYYVRWRTVFTQPRFPVRVVPTSWFRYFVHGAHAGR